MSETNKIKFNEIYEWINPEEFFTSYSVIFDFSNIFKMHNILKYEKMIKEIELNEEEKIKYKQVRKDFMQAMKNIIQVIQNPLLTKKDIDRETKNFKKIIKDYFKVLRKIAYQGNPPSKNEERIKNIKYTSNFKAKSDRLIKEAMHIKYFEAKYKLDIENIKFHDIEGYGDCRIGTDFVELKTVRGNYDGVKTIKELKTRHVNAFKRNLKDAINQIGNRGSVFIYLENTMLSMDKEEDLIRHINGVIVKKIKEHKNKDIFPKYIHILLSGKEKFKELMFRKKPL